MRACVDGLGVDNPLYLILVFVITDIIYGVRVVSNLIHEYNRGYND